MATVTITDPRTVLVDGASAGNVVEVCRNFPQKEVEASSILDGLDAWATGLRAERDTAVKERDETTATKDKDHAEAIAALEAEHKAAIEAMTTDHTATVAKLQTHIDSLGGTAEAIRLKKEADRTAAEKAKADAEAKLAELDKATADVEAVKV